MARLSINISAFRCISEASINIDGITVLAGLNASGKSTISRLFYYIGYFANNYEELLTATLTKELKEIVDFLQYFPALEKDYISLIIRLIALSDIPKEEELLKAIDDLLDYYTKKGKLVKMTDKERLGRLQGKRIKDRSTFINELENVKGRIKRIYEEYSQNRNERPVRYLSTKLNALFKTNVDNVIEKISVLEDGHDILSKTRKSIGLFTSLQNVFYIDTPMIANILSDYQPKSNEQLHWSHLIQIFNQEDIIQTDGIASNLTNEISKITGGAIYLHETDVHRSKQLLFKDTKGHEYPIAEMASGIKSFAILQRLLQKKLLNRTTLLIIDEPEAHLHPQWIIEYARLIHTLHRKCGVRFLITSHSPLMIEALHNLAKDEELSTKRICYYMAKKDKTEVNMYHYESIGVDIDKIFALFNTSYDMMDRYEEQ